ncbi:hypothetical protein ACTMU2_41700 [Cupriavidus basilensis]
MYRRFWWRSMVVTAATWPWTTRSGSAAICDAELQLVHVIDNGYLKYDMGYVDLTDLRSGLIKGGEEPASPGAGKGKGRACALSDRHDRRDCGDGRYRKPDPPACRRRCCRTVVLGTHGRHEGEPVVARQRGRKPCASVSCAGVACQGEGRDLSWPPSHADEVCAARHRRGGTPNSGQ